MFPSRFWFCFTFCVHALVQFELIGIRTLLKQVQQRWPNLPPKQCHFSSISILLKLLLIMKWTSGTFFPFFSTFERIAKKILLAQIKANLSASDDMSWDDETQTDDSKSDGDQEVKEGDDEENAPLEDGKLFFFLFFCTFVDIIWAIMWLEFNTNLSWVVQENTLKRLCV